MFYNDISWEMYLSFHNMAWLVEGFARIYGEKVRKLKKKIEEQRPNEVDYIYHEVREEAKKVIIDRKKPDEVTLKVHGLTLRKKIVHMKGEDYHGADVYFEVENEKFALVQFKKQKNDRYEFDQEQLDSLTEWCDLCAQNKDRPPFCPAFFWLVNDRKAKHRIVRACQLKRILGKRKSARCEELDKKGVTRSTFRELLARCWVGAPSEMKPSEQKLEKYATEAKRLIVSFTVSN